MIEQRDSSAGEFAGFDGHECRREPATEPARDKRQRRIAASEPEVRIVLGVDRGHHESLVAVAEFRGLESSASEVQIAFGFCRCHLSFAADD